MFAGALGEEQERATQRRILERRKRDEERRLRLLNAKQRVMGLDKNGIEAQIKERQAAKAAAQAADSLYSSTNEAIRNILEEENLRLKLHLLHSYSVSSLQIFASKFLKTRCTAPRIIVTCASWEVFLQSTWIVQLVGKCMLFVFHLNVPGTL